MTHDYPNPPDKPPAETHAKAVQDNGHLYLLDPGNEQVGYIISANPVNLGDIQ